jgi:polygalacturonase
LFIIGFRKDAVAFLVSRRVVLFGVRFDDGDDEIFDAQSANFLLG